MEPSGTNLAQAGWAGTNLSGNINYYDTKNHNAVTADVRQAPFKGGAANDPSPYKGKVPPVAGDPPDWSQPAGFVHTSSFAKLGAIKTRLDATFRRAKLHYTSVASRNNIFVSMFMGYHVMWYRDYSKAKLFPTDKKKQCPYAWHTHVGMQISARDATRAAGIQLDVLIDRLEKERK